MKKQYIAFVAVPVLALTFLAANIVSAHGFGFGMGFGGVFGVTATPDEIATRQQTMFQDEANLLGISVDAVKTGWAQGKTLPEIATDNGLTADQLKTKMQAAHASQLKKHMQTLVAKGIITQAQADQRVAWMTARSTTKASMGRHRGMMHFFPL